MKQNLSVRSLGKRSGAWQWRWLVLLFVTSFISFSHAQETSYEVESGTLAGGANVQACRPCSGSNLVGYLGGTTNGAVTTTVNIAIAGAYTLKVHYASGDARTIAYTVNGTTATVSCPATGGWTTVGNVTRQINLIAGNNTIRFDNNAGWAPNVDRFTLTSLSAPITTESESGTRTNGANVQSCSGCSGTQMVGNLGGTTNGAVTHTVSVGASGTYTLVLSYASADPRTIFLSANNATATAINCAASGGWATVGTTSTTVNLIAGNNTIKFNNGSGWGPNLDKFVLTLNPVCPSCIIAMNFANGGRVDYNLQTGNLDVFSNNNKIVADAQAQVKNGSNTISSRDYATRTSSQTSITDGFGSGTKYTITLTGNGYPQMQQIFYVYPLKSYFTTEVILSGTSVTSNYMAPLVSNNVNIQSSGDSRVLFSPFDNDTFIRYDAKSMNGTLTNTSSEVTAVYENNSRNGIVTGSIEHSVWKTGVRTTGAANLLSELTVWGGYTDVGVTRDNRAHGSLTGTSVKSPRIFVGYYSDWRTGMEDYGKATRTIEPPYIYDYTAGTPFGWNSWGAMQSSVNLTKAKSVADFFANSLPSFRNDNTAYLDLDSYWDNMSTGGLTGDFSQLTEFANYCKSKGLKPGIYWAPFVDWGKTERPVEGSSYTYSQIWTHVNGGYHDLDGCRAIDPTHPGTQQRLAYVIGKFKACGFEMIKIDFIGHAAVEADSYYDTSVKTGMQAFRKGMEYLVDQLANQMLVYVAISPNLGTNRYSHMRRIACDAYSAIGETQYTLNSTSNGWWQTYVYDYIDGDHLVLGTQSLGANRARVASGVITGTVITGDDFSVSGQWSTRAQTFFQNQAILDIARNGMAFRPVEGNAGNQASELFGRQIGNYFYLAVFNYGSTSKSYNIPLSRIGLSGSLNATELFSNTTITANGTLSISLPAADAAIYRFTTGSSPRMRTEGVDQEVTLFPNPSSSIVNVNYASLAGVNAITHTGATRALSFQQTDRGDWYTVMISDLSAGVYILRLTNTKGQSKNLRLIKE